MIRSILLAFASAAAIGAAAPLGAQDAAPAPAPAPVAAPVPVPASDPLATVTSGVGAFYATRNNAPVWIKDVDTRAAAQKLPAILRRAPIDGLAEGSDLATQVEAALVRGQPEDDKLISAAWVRYVQALSRPVPGVSYGDPALALQMPSAFAVLGNAAKAPSLADHVDQVAEVNPLYSALRDKALQQAMEGDPRIRATLDRLRLLPAKGRAIVVDSATARLWTLEDGRTVDTMKVVVGRKATPTPLLAGTIHYVTVNPYWNIPEDVARKRVAPLVLKRGVSYLKAARYVTADRFGGKAELVDPTEIDWKAVAAGEAPVHIRQLPGGNNMMGAMKFGFVNDYDIFLHDTPRRELFARAKRAYSMGCIRLEHADRLARWLLGHDPVVQGDAPDQHIPIDKGVPIYVTYLTASIEEGQLAFADDVYGLDPLPQSAAPVATAAVTTR